MPTVYEELASELHSFEQKPEEDFGSLGYSINDDFTVIVGDRPYMYRVRMDNGSFLEIEHRGRAQPSANLRVVIRYDKNRVPYIYDVINSVLKDSTNPITISAHIGPHSHHRGSGMEFPIDPRLLTPLSPRTQQGLSLRISGGFFYIGEQVYYFTPTDLDLRTSRPALPTQHRWVIIGLDTVTRLLRVVNGTPQSTGLPLSLQSLAAVVYTDLLPLFGLQLRGNQTQILDRNIESMVQLYMAAGTGGSSFDVSTDAYWVYDGPLMFVTGEWTGVTV